MKCKPAKSKSLCGGCYNDDYNHGLGGAKECWSYASAKVIKRIPIHVDQRPPYDLDGWEYKFSCFNRQRMVYVSPDSLRKDGYWR